MSETSVPSPGPGAPASSATDEMEYVPATSVGGRCTSANAGAAMTANAPAAASTPARKPLRTNISRVWVRCGARASRERDRNRARCSDGICKHPFTATSTPSAEAKMTDRHPTQTRNLDRYGNPEVPWSRAHDLLESGPHGPVAGYFLATR